MESLYYVCSICALFAISKLGSVKKRTGDQDKNSLYWQNTPENPSECWIYSKIHACILFKQPTGKTLSADTTYLLFLKPIL